jgi:deoxyribose-phosphate aldolase
MDYTYEQMAKMIDHSLLNPTLSDAELEAGCRLAVEYGVASVCIKPYFLHRCAELLAGTGVLPSTVIGFPHGGHATAVKVFEAKTALADGGVELDAVVNIGKVIGGDWNYVSGELRELVDTIHGAGAKIKVIFENSFLTDQQKIHLCGLCGELGADWVKTSTGYASGGATLEDLRLMRANCPPQVQVKAAGGVRDLDGLLAVRAAGATRCGATRTVDMLTECRRRLAEGSKR